MRYFYRLAEKVVVEPIMMDVQRQPELWNTNKMRTTFQGTPHGEVSDVLLRFGKPDGNDLEAADTEAMRLVRGAKATALSLMQGLGGSRLGRVVITKLEPGKKILPHKDVVGEYARYYSRYHVVLMGLPGSLFTCGDETVNMLTGEVWWFDAAAEHSLMNNSKDDRVHMLVDVRVDR